MSCLEAVLRMTFFMTGLRYDTDRMKKVAVCREQECNGGKRWQSTIQEEIGEANHNEIW